MPTIESRFEYASKYAALGWPVLPLHWITERGICSCGKSDCRSAGKHPLLQKGLLDAATDTKTLNAWFNKWPQANIGIRTGAASGIFVLDVDPRHGGDDALEQLKSELGSIPDDVVQVTGSGGSHICFRYAGPECRSTTNFYPGIDLRGDGGFIVVEPSNHVAGGDYFWDGASPLEGAKLPELPSNLLAKLRDKKHAVKHQPENTKLLPVSEVKKIRAALGFIPDFDSRDQWRTIGMALHSTGASDQAFGLWGEWSQQSDKFNLADQRRVWNSFKPGGGVNLATLFGIAKGNGYSPPEVSRPPEPPLSVYEVEAAQTETSKQVQANKPKRKPNATPPGNAEQFKRFVFLKNHNRIFDTVTRNELSRDGFDGAFLHVFPDHKPSAVFLKNPATIKVDGLIYLPGETDNPVHRDGAVLWNIWRDPGVRLPDEATREDVEQWLEHLNYLYPNPIEQAHILNWMASTLQRPQCKINHALLIAGTSRVGKDMLLNPLRYGLGSANVCEPPAGELKESFTDYLHHSKLVIFQEIQTFEGLNLENKLKPMLAAPPDMLRVRLFGRGFYETPNIVQAIFMSNYKDALHISEGDGRYFAVWTDAVPRPKEYYNDLARWLDGGGNGLVVRWLLDRDLSDFNPKQPAPLTRFKSELIGTSKSPLKHQIEDMIAAGDYPFNVDCVRSIDVAKAMRDKYSAKSIGVVMAELGCLPMMCKRSTGKREKVALFAVRDIEGWRQQSAIKWLGEYDARRD
ncbi:bifunctional DNA primase/polymerase [Methylomonas sp. MK1]|uniref:bifunctional DNA primase/polymerase n=1 Tax=Methylomonas sp. MK1 TaxID=1131552 RepID=UPI001360B1C7|nr:bifunctional DNA primase/polymerase [Methylomonas sp. MK1]